jgi:outer membrane protein TolC
LPDPSFEVELMDVTNAATGGPTTLLPGQVGTTRYKILQPLPFFGKLDLRGKVAEERAAGLDAKRDLTELEVEAGLKIAFARYYQAVVQARILAETLDLYRTQEQVVLTRYGVGLAPQQDALQIQNEKTATQVDLIEAKRKQHEAMATLNALLNRDPDAPLAVPRNLPTATETITLDALKKAALDHSPALALEQTSIKAASDTRDLTTLDRYPDFALGVRYTSPRDGLEGWDVILQMSIPLQQSAKRSREADSEYQLQAAMAGLDATHARILGRLGGVLAGYESSRDKANIIRGTLLPQARATLQAAQTGYANTKVNFDTLIQAARQILRARLELLDAETDTALRLAELEQLTGIPL